MTVTNHLENLNFSFNFDALYLLHFMSLMLLIMINKNSLNKNLQVLTYKKQDNIILIKIPYTF